MTTINFKQINKKRDKNGVFSVSNDVSGWYALSKDNIHMITFYEGKWTFAKNDDKRKFYTEKGFVKRLNELLKRGY